MDWKALCVLVMFIGMTAGYNASIEPTINDSATQVSNELYRSLDSNSWLASVLGGWFVIIAVFVVLLLILIFIYVVIRGLGWFG